MERPFKATILSIFIAVFLAFLGPAECALCDSKTGGFLVCPRPFESSEAKFCCEGLDGSDYCCTDPGLAEPKPAENLPTAEKLSVKKGVSKFVAVISAVIGLVVVLAICCCCCCCFLCFKKRNNGRIITRGQEDQQNPQPTQPVNQVPLVPQPAQQPQAHYPPPPYPAQNPAQQTVPYPPYPQQGYPPQPFQYPNQPQYPVSGYPGPPADTESYQKQPAYNPDI